MSFELINLWTELSDLVKLPVCTCKGCKCCVSNKILTIYKEDRAHQFLMGLNDELYATLARQILALDPLPSLDKIFNITQQEESHKKRMIARDNRIESGVAFAVKEQG